MKRNALEQFTRSLLRLFGGPEPGRGCLDEATLAALATGERLPFRARRRSLRHAARCPACMEKLLLLRELEGQRREPLFQPGAWQRLSSPAWRPLASAAALVLVAGLLYLGGVTFQRLSAPPLAELERIPAAQTAPAVESGAAPVSQPPADKGVGATPGTRAAKPSSDAAPVESRPAEKQAAGPVPAATAMAPADRNELDSEDPLAGLEEDEKRKGYAPEPAAPAVADLQKDQPARSRQAEEERAKPAPPPAPTSPGAAPPERAASESAESREQKFAASTAGGAAVGRAAAKKEHADEGETSDLPARLAALCRAARTDGGTVHWRGRTFRRVGDQLLEEGVCEALGSRPVTRLPAAEVNRLRRAPGFDTAWRGVWFLTPGAILLLE